MSMIENNETVFYVCDCCGKTQTDSFRMCQYYDHKTNKTIHYCGECRYKCGFEVCGHCHDLFFRIESDEARKLVENLIRKSGVKVNCCRLNHYALIDRYDEWICWDCTDKLEADGWIRCDRCGAYSNEITTTDCSEDLCPNCYAGYLEELEERESNCSGDPSDWEHDLISSYHESILEFDDPEDKLVFGTEFEFIIGSNNNSLNCYEAVDSFVRELTNSPITSAIEKDASVDFEVISAPEGLDKVQKNLSHIIDVLSNYDCKSWDHSSGCGLHFHVNRRGVHHIKNIVKFFVDNQTDIIKLSGRTPDQITSWCRFDSLPDLLDYSDKELLKGTLFTSRYSAINFNNRCTIEFRLFRASLRKERVNAYIAFLKAIFKNARFLNKVNFNQLVATSKSKDLAEITGIPLINKSLKQVMRGE